MSPFELILVIIISATIGSVLRTKYLTKHGMLKDKKGEKNLLIQQDNSQQLHEIKELKDRVQTLERIVTDNNKAIDLDREIESLRNT